MAIISDNLRAVDAKLVVAGSALTNWVTVNRDARTTQSTTVMCSPTSVATSTPVDWLPLNAGVTRVLVRARYPKATTVITTSPTIRVIGLVSYKGGKVNADGSCPTDGTLIPVRLDSTNANAASITLTLGVTATTTFNDPTYWYSNPIDIVGYDTLGCDYVSVFVEVGANITASAAVEIQLGLMN